MNERTIPFGYDHSDEFIDRAVAAVALLPMPEGAVSRTIETALGWETASRASLARPRRWMAGSLAAAATMAIVGFGLYWWTANDRGDDGADALAESGAGKQRLPASRAFYMPVAMTNPAWADTAPVFVTIGPEKPVALGTVVAHREIGRGLAPGLVRLHVWDWSKSSRSRVLEVKRSQLGVLLPDGMKMLSDSGEVTDLATGAARMQAGLKVEDGRRLARIRFSPRGTYAAAMIHVRTQIDKVQADPPLFSATHWWSLRIVRLDGGKIVGEFPADANAGLAFAPDETSLVYSNGKNVITRRDVASGKVLNEYQPDLGLHGGVGIAISPDGRFVAAGQYRGQLYVWELRSGMLILRHQFLRDNGEHDTFFQAKVMQFSPDGELLALASGGKLKVLETRTGTIKAQHYNETTPSFVHLRWSPDAETITLLTYSDPTDFSTDGQFPPRPSADVLPRLYDWDWQEGGPVLKQFRPSDQPTPPLP